MNAPHRKSQQEMEADGQREIIREVCNTLGGELLETHISWVILAEKKAYKIKKALKNDFLDYSTLAKRRQFCEAELQLNARYSEDIYLKLATINADDGHPILEGEGEVLEYAVCMQRFDHKDVLLERLNRHTLTENTLDKLLDRLWEFQAPRLRQVSGKINVHSELIYYSNQSQAMLNNFRTIRNSLELEYNEVQTLAVLEKQTMLLLEQNSELLLTRFREGKVYDGHGDLHLNNMVLLNDKVQFFDGIEFNVELRTVDAMSELAFIVMDLEFHSAEGAMYSWYVLNGYLQKSGDYEGLPLLKLFKMYRAMVRAKVAALTCQQGNKAQRTIFSAYLSLAQSFLQKEPQSLSITFGLSGSGKSTLSRKKAMEEGAIWIRSDVERKRLFLHSEEALESRELYDKALYNSDATVKTYQRLLKLAKHILQTGYSLIVDATFLKKSQREPFYLLAQEQGARYRILHCRAPEVELVQRLKARQAAGKDASDADVNIMFKQKKSLEALDSQEQYYVVEPVTE